MNDSELLRDIRLRMMTAYLNHESDDFKAYALIYAMLKTTVKE